ncbi:MAG: sigma-70 family RNA polymerase sigma factor [Oscillospiraceae bacterium]|nr:sigma-70 family RNA polymerase sigma factor [Oscillospiraceae bacterium]
MNDKQLKKLLRTDPAEGIRESVTAYSGLLTAVVARILRNPQEAEECVADTFISLWKNIDKVGKIDSVKAYLLCIARNNAIDRYRRLRSHDIISVDAAEGFEIVADNDVELLVVKKEFMDELQGIISKLPEPGREIFTRKYFLFESVREIAESLGLNEVQVKDRLYRTRKQIRKNCQKKGVHYEEIIFTTAR